ncbi:hypothetical protein AB0C04_31190, partial [Micromonospora sp. NPDC048909]|uniref:hypothetical protein n=1 Tax=Micromonospora sp. NPDC048909 TaxID=3155643 RepID=UPI00340A6696
TTETTLAALTAAEATLTRRAVTVAATETTFTTVTATEATLTGRAITVATAETTLTAVTATEALVAVTATGTTGAEAAFAPVAASGAVTVSGVPARTTTVVLAASVRRPVAVVPPRGSVSPTRPVGAVLVTTGAVAALRS